MRFPFRVQLPFFQNEPIAAVTGAAGSEPAGERSCEFCECRLTSRGEVLRMSDKARGLRTLEDRLHKEETAHNETRAQLSAAQTEIAELRAAQAPKSKKNFLDID